MKWASLLLFFLTLPLVFNAPPLEILRLKTFDALVETPDPTGYFTILNIDEEYLDKEGGYPLPRKTLADIHLKLLQNGALGVGWVMLFPHPDRLGGDEDFAYMLSLAPSVIAMPEINNEQYPETHGTVILGPDVTLPQAQGFLENIPQLKEASAQGAVSVPVDVDNLVRQIPLIQQTPEGWVASFGTEVLKILGGGNTYQIKTNENGIEMIRVKGIPPIPTDSSGKKWISWVDTPETTMSEMDVKDKFVGMIMSDDVLTVLQEEAEEDALRLAGVGDEEITDGVITKTKRRFNWLLLNLFTAFLATWCISLFGATIEQMVVLAFLMPIVASMGGNAGMQTLAVTVRTIATNDLTENNFTTNVIKEFSIGILNGIIFAVISAFIVQVWFQDNTLSIIISISMVLTMIIAGLFGILVPVTLKKMNIDPAIASSVFVTTITDVIGFVSFLGVGAYFL